MFGLKPYNYESFTRELLVKEMAAARLAAAGPKPGERAPDFEARTLEGDIVRLSDFRGEKNVALTFGSATCPMTSGSIAGMNDLYDRYHGDDVEFLFVYVREAHPGDELPAHETMDDKVAAAELLREEEEIEMPIMVDDLRGTIHRKYGKLPNPTFLIDKSGRIAFRALWTQSAVVREALDELLERQEERGVDHAIVRGGEDVAFPARYGLLHAHRALQRGGRKSITDFEQAMGMPGRLTVWTSRIASPVAENPGWAMLGALAAGGVIVGALFAGRALRQKRLGARTPYDLHEPARSRATAGDYEAVGI